MGVVASIDSWGKQHVGWARCIDQNIAKVKVGLSGVPTAHVTVPARNNCTCDTESFVYYATKAIRLPFVRRAAADLD